MAYMTTALSISFALVTTVLLALYGSDSDNPYASVKLFLASAETLTNNIEDSSQNWVDELAQMLSPDASIHTVASTSMYQQSCETLGTDAYAISAAGNGICMHSHDCAFKVCHPDSKKNNFNLPAHTIDVRTESDVSAVLKYVHDNNLVTKQNITSVSVKTTGHSYQGQSTSKDSLLIWMHYFEKDGTIKVGYEDSCGRKHDVVGIGGGETWDDVLEAVKGEYHVVTGGGRTVSAAGGWLQGGGLSFSSRKYGIGVDNVIDFRVVLPNGTVVIADACSNPDLFFALRGGGGGTYGVVTHVHYKLHPVTEITVLNFGVYGLENLRPSEYDILGRISYQWLQFWIENSPELGPDWCGGFFMHAFGHLLYCGSSDMAQSTFIGTFEYWYNFILDKSGTRPGIWGTYYFTESHDNWYEYKGGAEAAGNPNMTDATGDAYKGVTEMYSRLMPQEVVETKPDEVLNLFMETSSTSFINLNYFLGGNIMNVPENETSVHPALRRSIWSVFNTGKDDAAKVRSFIPNDVTGICYNHHNPLEPDWSNASWGNNYNRLSKIKEELDSNKVLNCWHCVGYEDRNGPTSSAPVKTMIQLMYHVPVAILVVLLMA